MKKTFVGFCVILAAASVALANLVWRPLDSAANPSNSLPRAFTGASKDSRNSHGKVSRSSLDSRVLNGLEGDDFFARGRYTVPSAAEFKATMYCPGDPSLEPFARAVECSEMARPEEALKWLNIALALNPKDAEALSARGSNYVLNDDYKRALVDLNLAIKIAPGLMRSYSRRGYVYLATGRIDEGISDLSKIINSDWVDAIDQSPDVDLVNRSKAYRIKGKLKEASADLALAKDFALLETLQDERMHLRLKEAKTLSDKILQRLPQNSYANLLSGIAALNFSSYQQAYDRFSQVIRRHPNFSAAYYFRADAANYLKNYAQAQKDYDKILLLKPRYVAMSYTAGTGKSAGVNTQVDCQPVLLSDVYFLKSIAYEKAGDLSKAVSNLETYLKLRPHDAEAYYELANYLAKQKKFSRAEQLCLAAQKLPSPEQNIEFQGQEALLTIYRLQGKNKEALALANALVAKGGDSIDAYVVRAQLYKSLLQYKKAIADYDSIISRDNTLAEVFAGRAEAYRLLGNKEQALRDYKQAAQLDRSYKTTLVEFEKKLK